MIRFVRSAVLFLVLGLVGVNAADDWLTDYQKALDQAKKENKRVLIDFTGSDWCGWCIKLDKEVFSTPEFAKYAKDNLVLLQVDFPRSKPQSNELKKQNGELQQKFRIRGYPTIVIVDGNGKKLGETGYMPGGPSAFIAELEKIK